MIIEKELPHFWKKESRNLSDQFQKRVEETRILFSLDGIVNMEEANYLKIVRSKA